MSIGAKLMLTFFKSLPLNAIEPIAKFTKEIAYPLLQQRRKIAMANLNLAFNNQISILQKHKILKQNLNFFGRGILELGKSLYLPPEDILEKFIFYGEEYLKKAAAKGKGIIAISAHMGNFPLLCIALCLKGYKTATIAKLPRIKALTEVIKAYTDKIGIKFISPTNGKRAAFESLQHLKKGGLLFLQLDQNAPKHRAMISFFGYTVPMPRSPVLLAQKTGATILPIFTIYEPYLRHKVFIEPPVELEGNLEKDLTYLMQIVETYVRHYPEQWWWWHRRWKEHIDYENL